MRALRPLVLAAWALGVCAAEPSLPAGARTFEVRGEVRRVIPEGQTVVVKHEEIPGYMAAMTMPFQVKDPGQLEGLEPGDRIAFRMIVTEEDGWIDRIRILQKGQPEEPKPVIPSIRIVREVEPLEVGDLLPDYTFTNELGRVVRFKQYRGQVVALTFIYTRCPYPTFCPRQGREFARASEQLAERLPDPPKRWHLFSLSFDPGYDTPSVLQRYARSFHYDPAHWSFLTGAIMDIDAITEQFGVIFARDGEGFSHNVRTVVVDPEGRIRKIFVGNRWTAEELVQEMLKAWEESLQRPASARSVGGS